jgi:MFS family permease
VATGLGFMNMFNMIGVLFAQPFIGYVLDRFWSGEIDNGVRLYSLHAYHVGLLILPLGILISLIILPFIKETYCEPFEFREENGTL